MCMIVKELNVKCFALKKNFEKLQMEELNRVSIEEFKQCTKIPVIVILDNVRSAQNVGSVFRTSDAFLIEKIYLCGITCKPPHKEIHKTALGAQNSIDWEFYEQGLDAVENAKKQGFTIISIEQVTNSTFLQNFTIDTAQKYALVFGNEVFGVSDEILAVSDSCIEIPQFGTKHSCNVSVSCGIVLWDFAKAYLCS